MENNFDNEFDRLFARDLNAAGKDARPDAEAWPALRNRLDAARLAWGWQSKILWLLLSLLLLSNGWLLLQWRVSNKAAAMPHKETVTLLPSNAASQAHETTIIYDTIYRTVVITSQVVAPIDGVTRSHPVNTSTPNTPSHLAHMPNTPSLAPIDGVAKSHPVNMPNQQGNALEKANSTKIEDNALLAPHFTPLLPDSIRQISAPMIKTEQSDLAQKTDSTAQKQEKMALPDTLLAQSDQNNLLAQNAGPIVQKQEKIVLFDSLLAPSWPILPTIKRHRETRHWRIGAGVGTTSLLDAHHIKLSNPIAFSLQGELLISRRWAIVPALTWQAYGYKTERRFDPRLRIDPPVFPGPDYRLDHIEGSTHQFSPSLSAQYRFRPEKRWSWYVSAGYAMLLTKRSGTEYEFAHLSNGDEKHYDTPAQPIHVSSSTLMQAGIEYAIKPRLLLFGNAAGWVDWSRRNQNFPMTTMLLGAKYVIH